MWWKVWSCSAVCEHIPQSSHYWMIVHGEIQPFFTPARVSLYASSTGRRTVRPHYCTSTAKEKRQAEVISGILLTLNINDPIAQNIVIYHCSSATSKQRSRPFLLSHRNAHILARSRVVMFPHTERQTWTHTHAHAHAHAARLLLNVRKEVLINISWPSTGRKWIYYLAFPDAQRVDSVWARGQTGCWWSFCCGWLLAVMEKLFTTSDPHGLYWASKTAWHFNYSSQYECLTWRAIWHGWP